MKRRIAQVSIALIAVVTLSACIIISSETEELAATPPEPAQAKTEA